MYKQAMKHVSYQRMWELNKIVLSRQPQTESDASELNFSFRQIADQLEDNIRLSEGKSPKAEMSDGEVIIIN